jgi:hypothetical protein
VSPDETDDDDEADVDPGDVDDLELVEVEPVEHLVADYRQWLTRAMQGYCVGLSGEVGARQHRDVVDALSDQLVPGRNSSKLALP